MPRDPPLKEGESWDEAAGAGAGGRAGRRGAGGGALQLGRDLTQTRPGQTRGCIIFPLCTAPPQYPLCSVYYNHLSLASTGALSSTWTSS